MPKFIHTMIRVLDLERSITFYRKAFAFEESYRLDFSNFTLVYLRNSETSAEIELTLNKERTEPYDLGDGYGHVAFVVDDLDETHTQFTTDGLEPKDIVDFAPDGEQIARFFFCTDPDGYSIEVLQKHGHFK
ncbi:MAG: VOC family protein [Granulosicoccus sp.]